MSEKSFIDFVKVFVKAGDGGDGCASFRREKFIPRGGPDGGDGGRGGDILAQGSQHLFSLMEYRFKRIFRAKNGGAGRKKQQTGKSADPMILPVPLGTVFKNIETGEVLGEIVDDQQTFLLQEGGKGGLGNQHFATSTNRAPRKCTDGEKREGFWIALELKILADVGLVGFPNAGKSTLLSKISKARPKIGAYPFTTLSPTIGVSMLDEKRLIISDIPGLIEGAHAGVGLGIQFLRHIQRCNTLLCLLNADPLAELTPLQQLKALEKEIKAFDPSLLKRNRLIVINKTDLLAEKEIKKLNAIFQKKNLPIVLISCFNGDGIDTLVHKIHALA